MKSASDQHEQSGVWRRMVGQGACRDNTCGFQAREQPVLQPQGLEERPCQWLQEEAQRERKEAGWNTEASASMSMCRP